MQNGNITAADLGSGFVKFGDLKPKPISWNISSSLNDPNKTISDKEFSEMVEAISTVETKETRAKMSNILFRHICGLLPQR